jgi:hypothetical protein
MEEVEDIGYFDEEHKFYKTEQSNVINQIPFHKINNPISNNIPNPISNNIPNPISNNIPNPISNNIPNPISNNIPNPISNLKYIPKKQKISYDDLLSSMGMKIVNGKLELYNKNLIGRPPPPSQPTPKSYEDYRYQQNIKNYSMTEQQHRKHVQLQYLNNQHERQRINQIKSKKILFTNPNTSVNIKNSNNLNKMFFFVR